MNGTNQKMRTREPWKQKHVNSIWDLHRYIYVTERLTQKAWEQLRDLGIGKDVDSTQAVAAFSVLSVAAAALELGELGVTETAGTGQSVCSFAD